MPKFPVPIKRCQSFGRPTKIRLAEPWMINTLGEVLTEQLATIFVYAWLFYTHERERGASIDPADAVGQQGFAGLSGGCPFDRLVPGLHVSRNKVVFAYIISPLLLVLGVDIAMVGDIRLGEAMLGPRGGQRGVVTD